MVLQQQMQMYQLVLPYQDGILRVFGWCLAGVWEVSSAVCLVGFTKVSEMVQQNNHILNIGQMSEILKVSCGALEGVWKMSGRCLDGVWMVLGRCLEGVWKVSVRCLEGVWKVSGRCLSVCLFVCDQVGL